jgi:hypothetical protein
MTNRLRLTIQWWHWLVFVLAVLVTLILATLLSLRSIGRGEYQQIITDLLAQKKIATIDDFVAHAPKVDEALQEEWNTWSKRSLDYPDYNRHNFDSKTWIAYVMEASAVPPKLLEELNDKRPEMEPARLLLQRPELVISSLGWIAQDLPPHKRRLPNTSATRMPNLLAHRALATWLHHEACINPDPVAALDDLDRLHAAFRRPGFLIDAMIWVAIANIRNEAYLHLALLGRLPEANRRAWLAESCELVLGVADAFDGERACFNDSWVRWVDEMSLINSFHDGRMITSTSTSLSGSTTPWWDPQWLYSGPRLWCTSHHDCAIAAELEAAISARLRGETATPFPDWTAIRPRLWGYGSIAMPNLVESAITALEADARHRMFRLAVTIIDQVKADGLPIDRDNLIRRLGGLDLLTPAGDHLHLTYECLGDDRFRLVVSPTSPLPNFDAPGRNAGRSQAFGKPPFKDPLVTRHHLEIQLPPRLRHVLPAAP